MDYLTLSVGNDTVALWLPLTRYVEAGKPRPGFGASERREHVGGAGWRRREPFNESRRWGMAYESWEWDGADCVEPSRWFRARDVRPSRVDVAWDFSVPDVVLADHLADAASCWMKAKGIKGGISGEDGVNTRYIGATSSERRLRIYRKDLQLETWLIEHGPTMRVELTLKGDHAAAWWDVWSREELEAFDVAAGHVFELTGHSVQSDRSAVPSLKRADMAWDPAQGVMAFMRQYGPMIDACGEAGIDVFGLVGQHQASRGRTSAWRRNQWIERIMGVGVSRVEDAVRAMIDRESCPQ